MKQIFFTLLLLMSLYFYNTIGAQAQLNPAFTARLDKVFDSVCTKLKIKGVSAALLVPNGGIWKGVHGISGIGNPIKPDMLFGIGSNTKTFVSATMLKLQENGLVNLNDTIGKWIINQPNISGKITIRQLLNHTSGLYNYTQNPSFFDSINADVYRYWKKEDILHLVGAPYFAPGIKWDYSNTNYILAGIIIEKITGKPVQDVIRDYILTPSGLNQTIFHPFETSSLMRADQWSLSFGSNKLVDPETFSNYSTNALFSMASSAGCIMQTAEDNVNFWSNLISGKIINTASFNEMRQYIDIGGGDGYGLGIFFYNKALNGRSFYSHGGTYFGYINENMADTTSKICISVLTNQDSINNNSLLGIVIASLHKTTLQMQTTGLKDISKNEIISMYPNPAAQILNISSGNNTEGYSVVLYDISGKQQFSGKLSPNITSISLEALESGYYFACVMDIEGNIINRQKIHLIK